MRKKEVNAANPKLLQTRRFLREIASGKSIRAAALKAELDHDEMRDIIYATETEVKRWTERAAAGKASWHYDIHKEAHAIISGSNLVSAFINQVLTAAEDILDDKARAKLYMEAARMQLMRATADGERKPSYLERAALALKKGKEERQTGERELKKEGVDKRKDISDNRKSSGMSYTKGGINEHQDGDTRH